MDDILAECQRRDCFRLLIEECLDGPRLQALEVFSIASEGSMKLLGIFEAIAYVEANMGELRDFVETVALNRGMPIATFETVADAQAVAGRAAHPGRREENIPRSGSGSIITA